MQRATVSSEFYVFFSLLFYFILFFFFFLFKLIETNEIKVELLSFRVVQEKYKLY